MGNVVPLTDITGCHRKGFSIKQILHHSGYTSDVTNLPNLYDKFRGKEEDEHKPTVINSHEIPKYL